MAHPNATARPGDKAREGTLPAASIETPRTLSDMLSDTEGDLLGAAHVLGAASSANRCVASAAIKPYVGMLFEAASTVRMARVEIARAGAKGGKRA